MTALTLEQSDALRDSLDGGIKGEVRFDNVFRAMYATDASVYQMMPLGVVIPRSVDDVVHTLQCCREHGVSITARGGGTSQAGQAIGAGIQLDFSKYMNDVLSVDVDSRTVRVQPGIVLDELNAQLRPLGLQLPLDLSTSNRATIGGMIANNSSGTRSVVYGKTQDFVTELSVVLSDGRIARLETLTAERLIRKCEQTDLEGACYRSVKELAAEHASEIERRYPKIMRRVGGYNLDAFVSAEEPFNLSDLIVGSEGTLALVVEAKLKLVPIPKHRVLCVIQFHEMLEALKATPDILRHQPSAVELMDRLVLGSTQGKTEFEPLRDFIVDDPGAVLIVEFMGDVEETLLTQLDQLEQELRTTGTGYHFHRAPSPAAQARIWKLRKAALGLSMAARGDAKTISYVEDTAVAPDRLHDYIARFQKILAQHDTRAGFYAHASVGLLHIRPVINMKESEGVARFARIAEQVADLVLEFGGALSGEHGDGLVRSPFQKKMFGPVIYDAFCQLKQTFDPDGLLNPGKIVHAPPLTENLKFGPNYETKDVNTAFDFSDFGGISRAAEQCGGVGGCRKTLTGTMCPSYMATRDEADSTRGRANALRMAISGQLGADGLSEPTLLTALDLCLECKACKTECPTGVDMARLKAEVLHQYQRKHGASRRARLLSQPNQLAVWGSRFAPISNWILQNRATRWLMDKAYGLDARRTPPTFARRTFRNWWSRYADKANPTQSPNQVAIFADTFTNHYEPQHAMAAVQVAAALGFHVVVPPRVCCGRPLISKGFLDEAAQQAAATTQILAPLVDVGIPIVFCEPSCWSAIRDDHPNLLSGDAKQRAQAVASSCFTFEQWAGTAIDQWAKTQSSAELLRQGPENILFHQHCHQRALDGSKSTKCLLSRIPGCTVTELDSGCCGMAGSFGYEREHYEVSHRIGERELLPAVRKRQSGTTVVAPGFSCRHQIRHFTGVDALSSMELLATLLRAP